MTTYVYLCAKCGTKHSPEELRQSRFCPQCGKFLTDHNRRVLKEKGKKKRKQVFKLEKSVELSIEKTYKLMQQRVPFNTQIDSLEVVKQVEEYRQFWKSKKTNVVLLAESHVHTDEKDYKIKCHQSILHNIVKNYPLRFVRFVYCLGYGENELLNRIRADRKNTGTPQYWKIFSSCVAKSERDLGFSKVLKTRTRYLWLRFRNKVGILRKMKQRGVWLLDASIIGLAGSEIKEDKDMCNRIIKICWDNHLEKVIKDVQPKHIIVIGKNVDSILHFDLQKLGFSTTVVRQPQGDRRNSQKQQEKYITCQRICAKYS